MRLSSEVTFRQPPREDPTPLVCRPNGQRAHRSAKRETSHGTVNSLLARIEREGEPTRPRNSVTRDASTESLGQLSSRYVARVHRTTPPPCTPRRRPVLASRSMGCGPKVAWKAAAVWARDKGGSRKKCKSVYNARGSFRGNAWIPCVDTRN